MKIIFVWIQGSGKWTQWKILSEKYGFNIFETGWALRTISKEESELWNRIRETINAWKLVDIKTIGDIITDFLNKNNSDSNIIFDWIPRSKEQKNLTDSLITDFKVILFDLPKEEVTKRLLWRMYNPKTGETFISWTEVDPKTGDKLEKRKDDNEEAIKQRIETFFEETLPVVQEYESEWKLIKINANQAIEKVTEELINKLGL